MMGSPRVQIGPSIPLHAHLVALQEESDRRYAEVQIWREKFYEERDRRYAEVSVEREKALKIKEVADLRALDLKSEIDKYKEEKANNLREQIGSERGLYATKEELVPINEFVSRSRGGSAVWGDLAIKLGLIAAAITLIFKFVN